MFMNDRPGGRTFDTERGALVRRLAVGRGGCEFWVLEWRGGTVPFGTVRRWRKEPRRYQASIEKAIGDIKALENEINLLKSEKHDRYTRVGNTRR